MPPKAQRSNRIGRSNAGAELLASAHQLLPFWAISYIYPGLRKNLSDAIKEMTQRAWRRVGNQHIARRRRRDIGACVVPEKQIRRGLHTKRHVSNDSRNTQMDNPRTDAINPCNMKARRLRLEQVAQIRGCCCRAEIGLYSENILHRP